MIIQRPMITYQLITYHLCTPKDREVASSVYTTEYKGTFRIKESLRGIQLYKLWPLGYAVTILGVLKQYCPYFKRNELYYYVQLVYNYTILKFHIDFIELILLYKFTSISLNLHCHMVLKCCNRMSFILMVLSHIAFGF